MERRPLRVKDSVWHETNLMIVVRSLDHLLNEVVSHQRDQFDEPGVGYSTTRALIRMKQSVIYIRVCGS